MGTTAPPDRPPSHPDLPSGGGALRSGQRRGTCSAAGAWPDAPRAHQSGRRRKWSMPIGSGIRSRRPSLLAIHPGPATSTQRSRSSRRRVVTERKLCRPSPQCLPRAGSLRASVSSTGAALGKWNGSGPPVVSAPASSQDNRAFMHHRPPPMAGPRPFEIRTSEGFPSSSGRRAAGFTPRTWFIGRHDGGGGADGGRTIPGRPVRARWARYLPWLGGDQGGSGLRPSKDAPSSLPLLTGTDPAQIGRLELVSRIPFLKREDRSRDEERNAPERNPEPVVSPTRDMGRAARPPSDT
jgi:hypothetical protein